MTHKCRTFITVRGTGKPRFTREIVPGETVDLDERLPDGKALRDHVPVSAFDPVDAVDQAEELADAAVDGDADVDVDVDAPLPAFR